MKKTIKNLSIMAIIATMTLGSTMVASANTVTKVEATEASTTTDAKEVTTIKAVVAQTKAPTVATDTLLSTYKSMYPATATYNEDLMEVMNQGITLGTAGIKINVVTAQEILGYTDFQMNREMHKNDETKTEFDLLKDRNLLNKYVSASKENFKMYVDTLVLSGELTASDAKDLKDDYAKTLDNLDNDFLLKQNALLIGNKLGLQFDVTTSLDYSTTKLMSKLNKASDNSKSTSVYDQLKDSNSLTAYKDSLLDQAKTILNNDVKNNNLKVSDKDVTVRKIVKELDGMNTASFANINNENINVLSIVYGVSK